MTKQDKSVERLRALGLDVTGKTPHQVTAELLKERALVDAKLGEWRNFESNLDRAKRLTEEKRILEAALLACPRGPEGVMRESDLLRCVEEELTRCEARDAPLSPELWQRWLVYIKGRFPERPPKRVLRAACEEFEMDEDDRADIWAWQLLAQRMPKSLARQLEIYLRAQIPAFNAAMAGTQRELRWWLWPLTSGGDSDWSSLGSLGRRLDDYLIDLASRDVAFPFQRAPAPVVGRIGPAP